MNYPAAERKEYSLRLRVRLAALMAVILFFESGIVTDKFVWYAVLWLIPLEVFLLLTSIKVFDSLKAALGRWFVVPLIRWFGRVA